MHDWVLQDRGKLTQEIGRIAEERDRHILGSRQADQEKDFLVASGVLTDMQALALTNSELVIGVCMSVYSIIVVHMNEIALTDYTYIYIYIYIYMHAYIYTYIQNTYIHMCVYM